LGGGRLLVPSPPAWGGLGGGNPLEARGGQSRWKLPQGPPPAGAGRTGAEEKAVTGQSRDKGLGYRNRRCAPIAKCTLLLLFFALVCFALCLCTLYLILIPYTYTIYLYLISYT